MSRGTKSDLVSSHIALQLGLSPMVVFATWIEYALDLSVQCLHDPHARHHRRPPVTFRCPHHDFTRRPRLPRQLILALTDGPRGGRVTSRAWWGLRRASGRPVEIRTDIGAVLAAGLAGE